ncbi:TetR/AcrR family transcriptional regulator [Pseudonocardia alaniniphila]|uniref:TetR/AcrR family transcriptional regulator n=1 Tax=Pseudonocardia alaniniphila TaxID=75291 RepID=A0ABS9TTC5_9PSEU|nr:TetR/AcrR family transcriptional regulator [Pseudonocardia alaniniphila]MCH6171643.1 TetR/AcrR family transcriptional regulator [Pseudonocardia alaniniphila]
MSTDGVVPAESRLTRKGRATRDRIVTTAAGLMFDHGVAGTSIEDVQAAAGVSSSQIYHYFRDKRALVRAVIICQTDAVLGAQQPLLDRLDSVEALRKWRDLLVGLQRERHYEGGCPIGSLAGELADTDPAARVALAAGFSTWESAIRAGIQAMRDRGELPGEADPERLARALLAALQGGLLLTQVRRDTAGLEAGLDTVIDHIASLAATVSAGTSQHVG